MYKAVDCYSLSNWTWLTQTLPAKLVGFEEEDVDVVAIKAIIWWMTFSACATILVYNLLVISHIYAESVSFVTSERFIIKKEVEYCFGINYNWLTFYLFYLSSYRPGVFK